MMVIVSAKDHAAQIATRVLGVVTILWYVSGEEMQM